MQTHDYTPTLWEQLKDLGARVLRGELRSPPWWLRDVGGSDFKRTGEEFLRYFIEIAHLQPDARVLEIGCGSGRMALPLRGYLRGGTYTGIDITAQSIVWCQQHISRRYPHFTFVHADLYNKRYNPDGKLHADTYIFPFADGAFDFIFLTSVFTHLLPADTTHYLQEIARLLAPQGNALCTFFLLNDQQAELAATGNNDIQFHYGEGPYHVRDADIPESAVAYQEAYVLEQLALQRLSLQGPIHYGTWSGRADGLSYQDILLVQHA
ncbi:MAG: class I SAM-dependent methyltransferase [Anaerolineae bacterium]|nr:class I SAM-dependent methyltransferase [Anaerolineae bacterium]